jgi:hypothetical protein
MIPRLVVNIRILLLVALAGILQNADLLKSPGEMSMRKPSLTRLKALKYKAEKGFAWVWPMDWPALL